MKIRSIWLAGVATSGIALAALTVPPVVNPGLFAADAATNISINISFGTFYDRLAPHGDWVSYRDRYVWVPDNIDARWRPYTIGHWAYTKRHGWLWVSDEPFGWAVYHYGRWGYARDIGWYWVPGRRWAPAWVAWHRTDRDVAWAPLPPDYDDGDDVEVFYSRAPAHYWQVVPVTLFLSINISEHIDRDRDHVRRIIREGEPGTVRVENNIVVNNYIDIDFIEQRTKKKVVVHEVKAADDPEAAGNVDDGAVAIFDPEVKEEADARPARTKKVEEVAKKRKASIEETDDPAIEESTAPAEGADEASKPAADPSVKKKKAAVSEGEETEEAPTAAETQPADDEPVKRKKAAVSEDEEMEEAPTAAETQPADDQSVKKKKKAAVSEGEEMEEAPAAAETQPAEDQVLKKKKKAAVSEGEEMEEAPAATEAAVEEQPVKAEPEPTQQSTEEQAPKAAATEQPAVECDPNTQDCAQAN